MFARVRNRSGRRRARSCSPAFRSAGRKRHIYGVGDVIGPFLFTHMADAQARVVVRNILVPFQFLRQKMDYSVVPWCTYVCPEIAHVGLAEKEAKQKN